MRPGRVGCAVAHLPPRSTERRNVAGAMPGAQLSLLEAALHDAFPLPIFKRRYSVLLKYAAVEGMVPLPNFAHQIRTGT